MKVIIALAVVLAASTALPRDAEAIGCLSGGALGAAGGHMAGHGVLGALGGCAAGHYANKYKQRRATTQQNTGYQQGTGNSYNNGIQNPTTGYPR